MDRRYELNSRGYTIEGLEQKVLDLYKIEKEDLYSKSRKKIRAEARGVFCCWGGKGVRTRRDPDSETLNYEPTRGRICC